MSNPLRIVLADGSVVDCSSTVEPDLFQAVRLGLGALGVVTELTVAVWPWLLSMLAFLMVVTYWPDLSLWLPRVMGMI